MLPSLFPLSSVLLSLEVVQEALLGAVAEVEQEELEARRAGHASRVLDEATEPPRRCSVHPSPENPPVMLPEFKAEKPEVPEVGPEEVLEEAGKLWRS